VKRMKVISAWPNSGHTVVMLRVSTKIWQSRTSYVCIPLAEIVGDGLSERGDENVL